VLVAVAFILSYLEFLLPLPVKLPGVKLGLCHIVVVFALYRMGRFETVLLSGVRVVLAGLLFGNMASLIYSLAGAALSLAVMLLFVRVRIFSTVGVSLAGAVSHNVGQILCAACLMGTAGLVWYLPLLLVAGCVSGTVIGLVAVLAIRRVPGNRNRTDG
jgi:heptaprenyl diphosphate synthase